MIATFVNHAAQYIQTSPWLAMVAVFVGGMLTASNPCVLATDQTAAALHGR